MQHIIKIHQFNLRKVPPSQTDATFSSNFLYITQSNKHAPLFRMNMQLGGTIPTTNQVRLLKACDSLCCDTCFMAVVWN